MESDDKREKTKKYEENRKARKWEQWSNILIWQLFENLPKIKYFLAYVNRSIGPTIKIILSVQDHFCQDFCHCPTNDVRQHTIHIH
jgi:hypothetical protein